MAKTTLETRTSESLGAISRLKNTERVFVSPGMLEEAATTGTWVLEVNSNVTSLATDDAGTTNNINIPLPVSFSDAEIQGKTGVTDRGVKIVALELIYEVAASALGGFDLDIWKYTIAADGAVTAAEVTTTLSFDAAADDGTEVDTHRAFALVHERDRGFIDSGTIYVGRADITDGTSSDVNIVGAIWHLERTEE